MSKIENVSPGYKYLIIEPYTPNIGAVIHDVDLAKPINDEIQGELKRALAEYEVIFFRDQAITPEDQIKFTKIFGDVSEVKAFFPRLENYPQIEIVESTKELPSAANNWHADITWQNHPPIGTSLHAQIIPANGGDTIWSSLTKAYESLDPDFQSYLETLTAIHTWEISRWPEYLLYKNHSGEYLREARAKYPPVEHPVVRIHPITGKKIIYVNAAFTSHIKGLTRGQSDALLAQLFELPKIPENQARFKWKKNSLAVWDNRSTQHYAVGDYFPQHRKLHRITISSEAEF